MNVLLIGGGGREHALAWKLSQSPGVDAIHCAPGNPGTAALAKCVNVPLAATDFDALRAHVAAHHIGLTVVGPEDPLAAGIVDALAAPGHRVFGPSRAAAQLEASKTFAKAFMARHNIPTAAYAAFDDAEAALAHVRAVGVPVVIKADGLAAGKGVTVAHRLDEAEAAIRAAMVDQVFGSAGGRVVIEEFLVGEEASILAFCDGARVVPMASSQDHKAAHEGDTGPNTGGMGAYSPAPVVSDALMREIEATVLVPCVAGMAAEGTPYRGVLYAGLMITHDGPKVVEFNCRFGDPETQVVLPRMETDLLPVLLACCDGTLDQCAIAYRDQPCVTVVLASGGYPGPYEKGKAITGIQEAEADPAVQVFHAGTANRDGALVTHGGRVLNVTATGADLPSALSTAYAAADRIHFEGRHLRRDIGQKALRRLGLADA
jgi:phosphoribosylamine--glycine ligase